MSGLRVLVLGVGDAFSAQHYSSCLALEAEGRWLLVDCPHPIRKILREASLRSGPALDLDAIDAVALTHLHADHASGLEGFGYFGRFVLGRKVRIAAHPAVHRRLWDGHLAAGMERLGSDPPGEAPRRLEDYFEWVPLADAGPTQVGPFAVECRATRHHVATTAFRIRAGGRCLGISADTDFDPGLVDWLAEADLVIHEVGLGIHTSGERLAALPAALRRRMRLTHYPDHLDLGPFGIEPLAEGLRLEV